MNITTNYIATMHSYISNPSYHDICVNLYDLTHEMDNPPHIMMCLLSTKSNKLPKNMTPKSQDYPSYTQNANETLSHANVSTSGYSNATLCTKPGLINKPLLLLSVLVELKRMRSCSYYSSLQNHPYITCILITRIGIACIAAPRFARP